MLLMKKVFVYGTLRRGGRLNYYMNRATFLGSAFLHGVKLYDLGCDVPGIHPGDGIVKGDLFEVDEKDFSRLLYLERGYVDTPVRVMLNDKTEHLAIAFVWPNLEWGYGSNCLPTEVESGDWMER
jgi:gamma-glutamylcyclotransferase (GGCT)/AIG2-like uncharacterized protein YtfP